ncbi:MAG TPA: T9SS type A sorting domain-containing protein [Bacteroidetes bacterium]|nr:T9SS type A sorting domain-containing protein [Bacteroidota bacterium]
MPIECLCHNLSLGLKPNEGWPAIYPNPNNGHFTLSLSNTIEHPVTARLIDSQGRVVWEALLMEGSWEVGGEGQLASGVYSLQMIGGRETRSVKIVVR